MNAGAARGLLRLTAATLFSGRRLWAAVLLLGSPPLLAVLMSLFAKRTEGLEIFQTVTFQFTLWASLDLLAVVFGLGLTSGEIEEGTAGYLYLGALPRGTVVLLQAISAATLLTLCLAASLLLTALASGLPPRWEAGVLACTLAGAAGLLVILSWSMTCGLAFRSPGSALAGALVPVFFWELLVTWWPMKFAAWTVTNNLRALLLPLLFDGKRGPLYRYVRNYRLPDYGEAALYLSLLAGLFLAAAMFAAGRRSIEGKESR
jgi:ABC-type transport system involved in multi-copper enzyme maturation permease subunit